MTAVLYREPGATYAVAVRGSGCWIEDADGRRYLDAVGGAAVVTLGHGVREITDAIAREGERLGYVYGQDFTNPWQERLAARITGHLAPWAAKVAFVSGGSEANETALKLARQYHVDRGDAGRYKVISRQLSYHGNTLAALAVSGRPSWRNAFAPMLFGAAQVAAPYPERCALCGDRATCTLACADDLERALWQEGADTVAAFIAEPIVGTTATGLVPAPGYYRRIREICDAHGILFIADEVLTGYGRTGAMSALAAWGVEPDLLTLGKGIASGYAPLGAVVVRTNVAEALGVSNHGFTFSGTPLACFVGDVVLARLEEDRLFERARQMGEILHDRLERVAAAHPGVIVRGRGLLAGLELVEDPDSMRPFPAALGLSRRLAAGLRENGVLVRVGVDGLAGPRGGDHIQLSPPFVIEPAEVDLVAEALDRRLGSLLRPPRRAARAAADSA